MKERILDYRKRIDKILADNNEKNDWQKVMDEHLVQIGFFQHERLIHLMVTMLFAVLVFICVAAYIISGAVYVLALIAILLVLLIPYIMHYYLLENETQKMYKQYDEILRRLAPQDDSKWDVDGD